MIPLGGGQPILLGEFRVEPDEAVIPARDLDVHRLLPRAMRNSVGRLRELSKLVRQLRKAT